MKKFLILVCIFVLSFGFMSCGKDGSGSSDNYALDLFILGMPTCDPGDGREFSVKLIKNGKEVDPGDVTVSTFKDSSIGQLRIWNDGGTIDIKSDKITKKYGEITDCHFGAVSGTGKFGLTAAYQGTTTKITLQTN
jgi:hypothetical protein